MNTPIFMVTRREFFKHLGIGAGAVAFGTLLPARADAADCPTPGLLSTLINGAPLGCFVIMKPLSGNVTILIHRSEMGQGTKPTLAAVLADELELDWSRVTLRQADADAVSFGIPYPYPIPGGPDIVRGEDAQFTDSSRSVAAYFDAMRLFGAGIKTVLFRAAARKWRVAHNNDRELFDLFEAKQQQVFHKASGRSSQYHKLLLAAKPVQKPDPATDDLYAVLKPRAQWHFIGKQIPFVDAKDIVTGKAVYGADADPGRGGMLTAMVERCPVANGTLVTYDPAEALQVPGVRAVLPVLPPNFLSKWTGGIGLTGGVGMNFVPHAGVAVVATNTWAALQGRRALRKHIQWNYGPNANYDSEVFRQELKRNTSTSDGSKLLRHKGEVDIAGAAKTVTADYYIPHLAQTPMEPPAAIALYENGKWEIWSPTQGAELAQHYIGLAMLEPEDPVRWLIWQATELKELLRPCETDTQDAFNKAMANHLGISEKELFAQRDEMKKNIRDKIKLHVTLLGGGFGRKSKPDYAIEAAFLAKQFPGTPVRVQWTREDDIKFSFYNAASSQHLEAGLDASGKPTSLLQRSAFTSFFATLFPPPDPRLPAEVNNVFAKARAGFHNGGEYLYGSAIERAQGLEDMPYDIDNIRIENSPAQNHIRTGWMRSVANIYHAFAICSFADEMGRAAAEMRPGGPYNAKEYLLKLIGPTGHRYTEAEFAAQGLDKFDNNLFPIDQMMANIGGDKKQILPQYPPDTRRLRKVLVELANRFGWDDRLKDLPKGHGLGIAAHRSFLSYVAIAVEVALNDANELTIHEISGAIDCGLAVNPDRVAAQMEGGMLYGLSIALLGEITVKNGAVVQNNFDDYQVLRIHQVPKKISTMVVDPDEEIRKEYLRLEIPPTGVGEPPTPAVAPALANAIVAAGGPRIREIPFKRTVVVL
jgi:isoquinoline 1-oxidoreductase beta subunit